MDMIPYKLVCIQSHDELITVNEELIKDNASLQSILMLDCGAGLELGELLNMHSGVNLFLFDSHRPISLKNLFSNDQVLFVDDGYVERHETQLRAIYQEALDGNVNDRPSLDGF